MSLILEALRKSEAERRRGQTPDLLTEALPVAPAVRGRTPNWIMLLPVTGAALITLLLVMWWLGPSSQPITNGDPANDASANDVSAASTEAGSLPLGPAKAQAQPSLAPPARQPPAPAATTSSLKPPAAATTDSPTAPIRNRTSAPARMEPEPALPTSAQVASIEQPAPPAPATTPVFASPDAPLKLSDLSTEDREQLPTLKVSMHMWSPDAGSRFAIIDGMRVNEGDRVGEATIEAIRQDSVMLSWHGRQIRLPIR